MQLEKCRTELAAVCGRIAERGLVIGSGGNVSVRHGDLIAITPTGAHLSDLTAEMISVVDTDGNQVEGELAPTSELALHLLVYANTPAGAVAHAHAMASTAVSCTHDELPPVHYTALLLGGAVRVAPYATFGSPELAANVLAALAGRTAALMQNHGSVTYGDTLTQAYERLELLEWLSELYTRCLAAGRPRVLSDADLMDVMAMAMKRNYGSTQPAAN